MSLMICQRIAALAALVLFAGCQAQLSSPLPDAAATTAAPAQKTFAVDNSKSTVEAPSKKPASRKIASADSAGPQIRTVFYRADAKPAAIPKVLLSKGDEAACKVKVGDAMPAIELPKLSGGDTTKLADLLGKKATVVVFWKGDRRMSQQQLADLGADVIEPYGKDGVAVVGIAVDESAKDAESAFKKTGAAFTNLHDADGKAFALVGSGRFPRTYLLDPSGKIVWFDIEYSLATRRDLHQALRTIAGDATPAKK